MNVKERRGKVYLEKTFKINFSREIGRMLNEQGWENAEEVFLFYDKKKGEIIVTRDFSRLMLDMPGANLPLKLKRNPKLKRPGEDSNMLSRHVVDFPFPPMQERVFEGVNPA